MSGNLLRDAFEFLVVLAVGGTTFSAVQRMRHGQIKVPMCQHCNRPISRAYPNCPKCGAQQANNA